LIVHAANSASAGDSFELRVSGLAAAASGAAQFVTVTTLGGR
jgi:hypothetical protein